VADGPEHRDFALCVGSVSTTPALKLDTSVSVAMTPQLESKLIAWLFL